MADKSAPISIEVRSAKSSGTDLVALIDTFDSYSFDRNILTPASAFRFTAPSVFKSDRLRIRSGDIATFFVTNQAGVKKQIGTGIIDETDTHVTPQGVSYVLTGRDLIGQLVDNDSVDANNKLIYVEKINLLSFAQLLIKTTRIPATIIGQQVPNASFLVKTSPGETKISTLQRYLDLANCLVWSKPNGQMIIGKPDFTTKPSGTFFCSPGSPDSINVMEARSRRDVNRAIRQIVSQLQTAAGVDATPFTKLNNDPDVRALAGTLVGRSIYRLFSYGNGDDAYNNVFFLGNQTGNPQKMGDSLSLREIARANMQILEVEVVVQGHTNDQGEAYDIDQQYYVKIDDDGVDEVMYVHTVNYQLTKDTGIITHMILCRQGTICAFASSK